MINTGQKTLMNNAWQPFYSATGDLCSFLCNCCFRRPGCFSMLRFGFWPRAVRAVLCRTGCYLQAQAWVLGGDGCSAPPFLGQIRAAGLTVQQLLPSCAGCFHCRGSGALQTCCCLGRAAELTLCSGQDGIGSALLG